MRRVPIFIVIAAAIGGIVWWLFQGPKPAPPVIPATSAPATIAQPESVPESRPEARKITPAPFVESRAAEPATRPESAAVFRGRCVDAASGAPLAGKAALHGWEANSERVDAYVARSGPIEWKNPPDLTIGADGLFEVRFVPPPPYQFLLTLSAPGHVSLQNRWIEVKAGEVIDVGAVPLPKGTIVRGRVLDEGGVPRSGVTFVLNPVERDRRDGFAPQYSWGAGSQEDGTFVVSSPLPPGSFTLDAGRNAELIEPQRIDVAEGEEERVVDVKVRVKPQTDATTGVVRDEAGNPVRGAEIHHNRQGFATRPTRSVTTDREGSFRLERSNEDPKAEVALTAKCTGYEPSASPVMAEWGAKDVVIVLRRGLTVQVVVIDAADSRPVERYGVRCFPTPGKTGERNSRDMRLRELGKHTDGVLDLVGVLRGRQTLLVEPEGSDWAPSGEHEFEMTDSGAPRQEVTVWRNVKKTVRVKRQDGSPVAKSKVQLLRKKSSEPINEETRAFDAGRLAMVSGGALLIAEGLTGEDGTLDLSGPPREQLVLRALGPGHLPLMRELEFGAADGIIDLVVVSGATFSGVIKPLELLPQLGTEPPSRRGYTWPRGSFSGVFLRRKPEGARSVEYPLGDAAAPIEPDGTFRFDGIPAGAWEVHLRYNVPLGQGSSINESHKIGKVDLVDGQERRETYDLGYLLQAEIDGIATLDGVPLEEGSSVAFEGTRDGPDGEPLQQRSHQLKVGAEGKFRAMLWPAEYCIVAYAKGSGPGRRVHGSEIFRIAAGEKLTKTFELKSSLLKLRVVASDGVTPLQGITLTFEVPKAAWPWSSRPTDAEGSVEIEGLPALPVTILAWPKSLATNEARMAYAREHKTNPDDQRVRIATITVTPPEASRTITLPASAGY